MRVELLEDELDISKRKSAKVEARRLFELVGLHSRRPVQGKGTHRTKARRLRLMQRVMMARVPGALGPRVGKGEHSPFHEGDGVKNHLWSAPGRRTGRIAKGGPI